MTTIREAAKQASKGVGGQIEKQGINKFKDRINDVYEMWAYRQYQKKEKGERFGKEHHTWWQWFVSHSYIFLGLSIIFTNYIYYTERGRRELVMCNIEENRRRHYGKLFQANEYMPYSPTKLYDGPVGYIQVDPATGIKTNAEGRVVSPNINELSAKLKDIPITSDMVQQIQELKEAQYAPDEFGKTAPPKDRKQIWTGFM